MFRPRGKVTAASWVMIPAHTVLNIWLGLTWIAQSQGRTSNTLEGLRSNHIDPRAAGVVLLSLGAFLLFAMAIGHLWVIGPALAASSLVYFALAYVASTPGPHQSGGGVPIWLYIGVAHLASTLSLALSETDSGRTP